jgi:hypothetical protein
VELQHYLPAKSALPLVGSLRVSEAIEKPDRARMTARARWRGAMRHGGDYLVPPTVTRMILAGATPLAAWLAHGGITPGTAAAMARLPLPALLELLTGERLAREVELAALARALRVRPEDLREQDER